MAGIKAKNWDAVKPCMCKAKRLYTLPSFSVAGTMKLTLNN